MVILSGMREAVAHATGGERMSLIQAQQPGARRLAFHDDGDIFEDACEIAAGCGAARA